MLYSKDYRETEAEVWADLPIEFRRTGVHSAWAESNLRQAVDGFLEGPAFDAHGRLHVVDIPFGRVFRIALDRSWELVAEYDGEPNGLKCQDDGKLLVADCKRGLLRIGAGGEITELLTGRHGERFRGLNDLTSPVDGTIYFTDQGQTGLHDPAGRVYRWQVGSQRAPAVVLDHIPSPNGLVLNPKGSQIYLAVTRENAIWRLPLQGDGSVTKVGRWIQLSGGTGPDGLACEADGSLWAAHLGMGCVWRFNARGEATLRVHTPGQGPTNVAICPRTHQVFATESERGQILKLA